MPETFHIDRELKAITITSHGEVTKEDLQESRRWVSEMLRAQGFKRVLVDASMVKALPSTASLFNHAVALASDKTWTRVRLAVVTSDKKSAESAFIETVALNRGVIVKNFDSREEAVAWLRE